LIKGRRTKETAYEEKKDDKNKEKRIKMKEWERAHKYNAR
jgi:hypothetical protein